MSNGTNATYNQGEGTGAAARDRGDVLCKWVAIGAVPSIVGTECSYNWWIKEA